MIHLREIKLSCKIYFLMSSKEVKQYKVYEILNKIALIVIKKRI